jgi:putative ABC transport system substrate-binding protein
VDTVTLMHLVRECPESEEALTEASGTETMQRDGGLQYRYDATWDRFGSTVNRRRLFLAASAAALVWHRPSRAQQPKVRRVGILNPESSDFAPVSAFRDELRLLGWAEGKNLTVQHQWAEGRYGSLSALMAELLTAKAEVVYAVGPDAARVAQKGTSATPIVAIDLETDPVASGFVKSLGRPGGNVTGLFLDLPELCGKWLQLVRELVPSAANVAAVGDPSINGPQFAAIESAARAMQLRVHRFEAQSVSDFEDRFKRISQSGAHAVVVFPSPLVLHNRISIAEQATRNRLPAIYLFAQIARSGGLMSYGPDVVEMSRRAASLTDKILRGAKPAELPVERPTKFELVVNLRTAKALGLTIPQTLLIRADELIQ